MFSFVQDTVAESVMKSSSFSIGIVIMWAVYADDINKPLGLVVNKGLAVTIAVLELVSPGHHTTKADVFLTTKLFPFVKGLEIYLRSRIMSVQLSYWLIIWPL